MKVVIITKAIYPMQSARSFRSTELAKELGLRGYDVTLYANIGKYDYDSFQEKYNVKVSDVGKMNFAIQNSDGKYSNNYFQKAMRRLFGKWLNFPDIEFVWKVPLILKKEANVDLLITIAVPHSIHWGAAIYKTKNPESFPKVWIADCGDPFMGNPFISPPYYFKYLEKLFCRQTDFITIPIQSARSGYYEAFLNKIHVIPQGFQFEIPIHSTKPDNAVITFLFAGHFYPPQRDPRPFLDYLIQVDKPFIFHIYTRQKHLLDTYNNILEKKIQLHNFIPRSELLLKMRRMDFLVNFENGTNIQSPSKLIDYAISNRPILSVDSQNICTSHINEFLMGNYTHALQIHNIEQYHITTVTNQFIELYEYK